MLFLLLKVHHKQIVATKSMRFVLNNVRAHLRAALTHQKKQSGFNMAAIAFTKAGVRSEETNNFIDEEGFQEAEKRVIRKRCFTNLV